jgi:predicted O-methyltransferase YrrM
MGVKFVRACWNRDPNIVLQAIGSPLKQGLTLSDLLEDAPSVGGSPGFEHLAALFASNSLNHGVIGMPIRQAAYLYRLVRENKMRRILEIGRHRGGSTTLFAVAMGAEGNLWSIDNGEKELRLTDRVNTFDPEIEKVLARLGVRATLMVGDSKFIDFSETDLDLVFIDGDHSYGGVLSDFTRFSKLLRVGGSLVFDDARQDKFFPSHTESVGRLIEEILPEGTYRLVGYMDRLAHLEKMASAMSIANHTVKSFK